MAHRIEGVSYFKPAYSQPGALQLPESDPRKNYPIAPGKCLPSHNGTAHTTFRVSRPGELQPMQPVEQGPGPILHDVCEAALSNMREALEGVIIFVQGEDFVPGQISGTVNGPIERHNA